MSHTDLQRLADLLWDLLAAAENRIDPDSEEAQELTRAAVVPLVANQLPTERKQLNNVEPSTD
jgi:hypothetical protein